MAKNEIRHQFTTTPSGTRTRREAAKGRAHRERMDDADVSEPYTQTSLQDRRTRQQRRQNRNVLMGGTTALLLVTGALALTGQFRDATPKQANKIPKGDAVEYVVPTTESPLVLAEALHKPDVDPLTLSSEIEAQVGKEANAGEVVKLDKRQVDIPPQPGQ